MVEVKFLGSGNAFCPDGRMHSLVLLDEKILIDTPPTILPQLSQAGLSPCDINTILFTHWHGDHIFGFPFFILERKYISDRAGNNTLNIHLHEGGERKLKELSEIAFPGSLNDVLENRVRFYDSKKGQVTGAPDWVFERFPVNHEPATEPHGYELQHTSGFTIIHCGDSGPCEEIAKRTGDADIVIIEVGVPDGVPTDFHFKPSSLSELAHNNPSTIFLATHLYTTKDEPISGLPENVIQVHDGDVFNCEIGGIITKSN